MRIAIGADHGGFEYKRYIIEQMKGIDFFDVGASELDSDDDYTDFSFKVADEVSSGKADFGIIVCRTGVGAVIAMNKANGVLAGLCESVESVILARQKNNINCLAFGADNISKKKAVKIVQNLISTGFDGGRHERRIGKILAYEKKQREQ